MAKRAVAVRWVDENTYDAVVTAGKAEYLRVYGGDKPTDDQVRDDFHEEKASFRKLRPL